MAQASLKAGLAVLLMLSTAPAVLAQSDGAANYPYPDYSQQQQDLQSSQAEQQQRYQDQQSERQQQQQQYEDARQRYEEQRQSYQDQQQTYQTRRDAYANARARYDADRAAYDNQYGSGAWVRYYADHADAYDARYGEGAWQRDFGDSANADGPGYYAPSAGEYGAASAYSGSDYNCENRRAGAGLVGGVIGAIAGGAIGSAVGRGAGRGGATAVGAVLGGVVGVGVGRSAAECDNNGYYFSYEQTYPYREGDWESGSSGRYDNDWYASHRCRLAAAPATYDSDTEYRYVRVCPDADGRYRITG
jgi:hypothetical protein